MKKNATYKEHPSYGTAQFTRVSGTTGRLFGSAVKRHGTTIRLTIHPASYRHDLGRDWIHGSLDAIVEVEMSASQFAELLTTLNVGSGVPCTIRRRMRDNGRQELIDDPPDPEVEVERVRHYFRESMDELAERLAKVTDKINQTISKKSVAKKDREEIRKLIGLLHQQVRSNFPFVADAFQEVMDKVVAGAKAEVDAFITHMATVTGLKALREHNADALIDATVSDTPLLPETNE